MARQSNDKATARLLFRLTSFADDFRSYQGSPGLIPRKVISSWQNDFEETKLNAIILSLQEIQNNDTWRNSV